MAERNRIIRKQGETLAEAGKYAAKEGAMMVVGGAISKALNRIGRIFRIGSDARKIAAGHAFAKHGKEFASLGIRTEQQFARHADDVMANPTATRNLERGRVAYWDEGSGAVVIRDPNSADGGTMFIPSRGVDYFNGLR